MKRIALSLIPLFLLSACGTEEETKTTYDIECQGQADGWHKKTQKLSDNQGASYLFEGQWHCKNEKLWYSTKLDEVNLFGKFYVTKTDTNADESKSQYHFIQLDKAQDLVIQQEATNLQNNNLVKSDYLTLSFLTDGGVLPQLFTTTPYSGKSYTIEYNVNNVEVAQLGTMLFKGKEDNLYQYENINCDATNNQNWSCEGWDSYYQVDKTEDNMGPITDSTKTQTLTPRVDKLFNNPLTTRKELIRLNSILFN
ncbi:hypothetical protein [Psychromonas sp. Urea-02u-13]|uniref:hypothetical protein n=1 Tax=Psychromonas sp. Urea-02u-13 TaxID=2058326 RepID=UPI000C3383A6|nr:hypothetical protein [Psychromonas sp. Urea-02u-13]PKG37267.1 hypothetical protein CXF74_19830 [Psychromonas sp. Urea-02u-13]